MPGLTLDEVDFKQGKAENIQSKLQPKLVPDAAGLFTMTLKFSKDLGDPTVAHEGNSGVLHQ